MTPKEAIENKIRELRAELNAHEEPLRTIQRTESFTTVNSSRFLNLRPLYAIRRLLAENGGAMEKEELIKLLLANGIAQGKKRGHHNVRISIDVNVKLGNLLVENGVVRLPKDTNNQQQSQSQL